MHSMGRRTAGFTLMEVLMVIIIIGILVSIAGTSVGKQLSQDRIVRATSVVEGMLVEGAQLAVRRRTPICIQQSGNVLQIVQRPAAGPCATGTVLKSRGFGPGSDLEATLTLNPTAGVTIFPNGRANADLTVTVEGRDVQFQVRRTATGVVRRI